MVFTWVKSDCDFHESYNLDSDMGISGHIGRWENPGSKEGMWSIALPWMNQRLFYPADWTPEMVQESANFHIYQHICTLVDMLKKTYPSFVMV